MDPARPFRSERTVKCSPERAASKVDARQSRASLRDERVTGAEESRPLGQSLVQAGSRRSETALLRFERTTCEKTPCRLFSVLGGPAYGEGLVKIAQRVS